MTPRMRHPTMRIVADRPAQSCRQEDSASFARLDDIWIHVVRRGFSRVRIALAEARLLYCDYEGPRAMSDTELSDLGITRDEIPVLVSNEAHAVVARTAPVHFSRFRVFCWS